MSLVGKQFWTTLEYDEELVTVERGPKRMLRLGEWIDAFSVRRADGSRWWKEASELRVEQALDESVVVGRLVNE